jgi:hypothetical protein
MHGMDVASTTPPLVDPEALYPSPQLAVPPLLRRAASLALAHTTTWATASNCELTPRHVGGAGRAGLGQTPPTCVLAVAPTAKIPPLALEFLQVLVDAHPVTVSIHPR